MRSDDTGGIPVGTRVCMVAYSYYPMDQRIRREAEALMENGIEIHVICLKNRRELTFDTHNDISIYRIPMRLSRSGGFLVYFLRYFTFLFLSTLFLTALFIKYRYRIIHVHSLPDYLVFCALPTKLFGVKIILDLHELMPEIFATKYNLQSDSGIIKVVKVLEKVSIGFSDLAITTSQTRKRILVQRTNKRKLSVVMNLPRKDTYQKRDIKNFVKRYDLENAFIISYVGRVDPVRELEVVVKAVNQIGNRIPKIAFILCGSGEREYLYSLKKLILKLKLQNKVILTGQVPQEHILNYIELSNVAVCPYRYYGSLGGVLDGISSTKVFEYLLVPKPVIVADFPANRSEFGGLAMFYKSGDPNSLAEKILEVYENQKIHEELAAKAQETLFNRYNPKKNEQHLLRIYEKLQKRNHPKRPSRKNV